jgi:hypothetical protein
MERIQKVEIIPNRLYWICSAKPPRVSDDQLAFSTDEEYTYNSYVSDFGPLDLSCTVRF